MNLRFPPFYNMAIDALVLIHSKFKLALCTIFNMAAGTPILKMI